MNLTKKQTNKLVAGCIDNNRKAQEELYKLFYADMLRVCLNYLPDREMAKEAFNTGFLKVFQSIKSFDAEKGEIGGWIRKIMIFTSIDKCRSELKFNHLLISEMDDDEFFIAADVLEKLFFDDILKDIRTLPLATQTVFNLSVLDGFSHKEIAEQLKISEGTSRWHLSEAKKRLRVLLETSLKKVDRQAERSGKAK
ncbi:sigma-70 family RNA polymerase sigma factor [Mucilaginibacter sp.]|uniref:RNA polymerase sigma factor n=1 Tax=Mucilaginibacter sp. TaxID=1882438 RepID=UPI002845B558|nr:sigma-70 family RNA polymerase sigma factor [Mucilaginibacter sp.]MDR3696543.1 sigma-70 family RNA polymerase sigma factor [Mucilaginibacter sp.]